MIKRTLLLLSASMLFYCSSAQTTTPTGEENALLPGSAGASAQGGTIYNTDLYTGTTTINIPIHSYSVDGNDYGISLGYSCAGVKVDQIASSVGMGWSINGLSYVERITNDLEDEICVDYNGNNAYALGAWNAGIGSYNNNTPKSNDLFVASLGGKIIKFAVSLGGSTAFVCSTCHLRYITNPRSNIKIELLCDDCTSTNPSAITRPINWSMAYHDYTHFYFRITDEDGTVYTFDQNEWQTKAYHIPNTSHFYGYMVNSRWWASSIVTSNGQIIQYTYNNSGANYPIAIDEKILETKYFTLSYSGTTLTIPGTFPVVATQKIYYDGYHRSIAQIKYPNGTQIDFQYRQDSRKDLPGMSTLQSIDISNGYDGAKNTVSYKLFQSYLFTGSSGFVSLSYNTGSTDPLQHRLFLNYIERLVNSTITERYYTFDYDEGYLPPRLSPKQDFFGYYNDGTVVSPVSYSSTTSEPPTFGVPLHNFQTSGGANSFNITYGTDKTPNFNVITHGILKKVTNGLGGEFEIYYEPHELSDPTMSNLTLGNDLTTSYCKYPIIRTILN